MDGWLVNKAPANYVRDQVPCTWRQPGDGICMKGSCVPAIEGCGNGLKEDGGWDVMAPSTARCLEA